MSKIRLLLSSSMILIILLLCLKCSKAKEVNKSCPPSSCGSMRNILFPFRLKGDPEDCGHPRYELNCENYRTTLHIYSKRYNVQSISYDNFTIRVDDPCLGQTTCASFPHDLVGYGRLERSFKISPYYLSRELNTPVIDISCEAPAKSHDFYINDTSYCSKNNSRQKYCYSIVREASFRDVEDSCRIDAFRWIARNASTFDDLAHGFLLDWIPYNCYECLSEGGHCGYYTNFICYHYYYDTSSCRIFHLNNSTDALICLEQFWQGLVDFWNGDSTLKNFIEVTGSIRFSCGILLLFTLVVYKIHRRHRSAYDNIEEFLQSQKNFMPIRYTYRELKTMTKNFKDKLGEGGYGTVFKGQLRSGPYVAVKMMGKSKASGQEFISEVATIGRIHHVNVVRLIGFCVEGSKRALLYEFMPNGSLEKYIFTKRVTISLIYNKVFDIALGVAKGVDYLHRGCDMQILHFDIKPHNILLDDNFNAKISDFGLAKLYPTDESMVSLTAARGTMGYMAPEMFYRNIGKVSYKSDVYSYGMLLMEMASKRRNLNPSVENISQIYFPCWVHDRFNSGMEIDLGDASLDERIKVKKMILVALWCIQMKPIDRPSMMKVIEMLEGDVESLQLPPKPFFATEEMTGQDSEMDKNNVELPLLSGSSIE